MLGSSDKLQLGGKMKHLVVTIAGLTVAAVWFWAFTRSPGHKKIVNYWVESQNDGLTIYLSSNFVQSNLDQKRYDDAIKEISGSVKEEVFFSHRSNQLSFSGVSGSYMYRVAAEAISILKDHFPQYKFQQITSYGLIADSNARAEESFPGSFFIRYKLSLCFSGFTNQILRHTPGNHAPIYA